MSEARVAAVMPVYGKPHITATAVGDLLIQDVPVDVWVVDNRGDHEAGHGERVLRPRENLGWLGGTNSGIWAARETAPYTHVLLVNNDVRLSPSLVRGLLRARSGIVAPTYNGFWNHQKTQFHGRAGEYKPVHRRWRTAFVDGTCLLVSVALLDAVGPLDPAFEPWGWGAEVDIAFRAAEAGFGVVVTEAAYAEHAGEATAVEVHGEGYGYAARNHMYAVLNERWGPRWERRAGIDPATHNTRWVGRRRRMIDTVRLAMSREHTVYRLRR